MNLNSTSALSGRIRDDLSQCQQHIFAICIPKVGSVGDIIDAFIQWGNLVGVGKAMDYKPVLSRILGHGGRGFYSTIPDRKGALYYDVWANISYGYVGKLDGFKEKTLVDASHGYVEEAGIKFHFQAGNPDASDDFAIRVGIELADKYPRGTITEGALTWAIMTNLSGFDANGKILH